MAASIPSPGSGAGSAATPGEPETERQRGTRVGAGRSRDAPKDAALEEIARSLVAELDLGRIVQEVTDAGTLLTPAAFAAFFYNAVDEQGESYVLYALSGAPRDAFEGFGIPRKTPLFEPTYEGRDVVRLDDVTADPRYGRNEWNGMPPGHLSVRSYMAVPVVSRSGAVHGGLFFGHPERAVFTEESEGKARSLAALAAVAIDNARLHEAAQHEVARRSRTETALRRSEENYRELVQALPAAIYTCDAEGRITIFNAAAAELWGRAPEIGVDRWCGSWRIFRPDGTPLPHDECPMAIALREGATPQRAEILVERPDGTRRNVLANPQAHLDETGRVVGGANMLIDVTEHFRMQSELQESSAALAAHAKRLEELDQRKDTFLAILGHELRNPLNAIATAAQILKLQQEPDPQRSWVVEMLGEQVGRAVELLNDLLDFSRITGGRIALRKKPVRLESILCRAVDSVRPAIESKHHELEQSFPRRVAVLVDPTRIEQVVVNLLGNAARYTPEGGRIALRVEVHAQRDLRISVEDDGAGIGPEQLAAIWEPFSQLHAGSGGLGIGLSLCKQLVELHKGAIRAESSGLGLGARFTVELPSAVIPSPASVRLPFAQVAGESARRRVLVVEDDRDAARALCIMLSSCGHEVEIASTGKEGLELARTFEPHVVLLDIGLPDATGLEVAARLKSAGTKARVVAVTGFGDPLTQRSAEQAGFDGFLLKPVDLEALTSCI